MQTSSSKRWQLVCRGLPIDVDFPVRTWAEHHLQWTGRHRTVTFVVVNHWTAAENPPAAVFANMTQKKLSVHFIVDQGGVVYQTADTELRCAHAGDMNAASIGIEFINRGSGTTTPNRGHARKLVTETIHGKRVRYFEFTEPQLRAAVKLNRALCGLYGLPLRVPLDDAGQPLARELVPHELAKYSGCLGHLHLESTKMDPGLGLLRALRDAG